MKKVSKIALAFAIYMAFNLLIQSAGEEVGTTVGELVSDGVEEIPEEISGIKDFIKKIILKERELLRKIFKSSSNKKEEDIVLTEEDKKTLKDIEEEVSEL